MKILLNIIQEKIKKFVLATPRRPLIRGFILPLFISIRPSSPSRRALQFPEEATRRSEEREGEREREERRKQQPWERWSCSRAS